MSIVENIRNMARSQFDKLGSLRTTGGIVGSLDVVLKNAMSRFGISKLGLGGLTQGKILGGGLIKSAGLLPRLPTQQLLPGKFLAKGALAPKLGGFKFPLGMFKGELLGEGLFGEGNLLEKIPQPFGLLKRLRR